MDDLLVGQMVFSMGGIMVSLRVEQMVFLSAVLKDQ